MTETRLKILLVILVLSSTACAQWQPDYQHAHANAQQIMKDEFLWSPIEETSPFGNDDGADAIIEFYEWRKSNKSKKAKDFIAYIITEWGYKTYNFNITDTIEINKFISSSQIGDRIFFGIDDIIIATGFGQLIIEGKIDEDLKSITLVALHRQLLPFSLRRVEESYRNGRANNLKRMIEIINAA